MNCCPPKPIWGAYVLIFFDLVGGAAGVIHGLSLLFRSWDIDEWWNPYIAAFTLPIAIMHVALGSMLWTGIRKGNDVYIFAFIVIKVAYLTDITLTIIMLMLVSGSDTGDIFGTLVALIIVWTIHYGVYLYYKQLVSTTTSMPPGNIVVTYDNIVPEESKMGEAAV